MMLNKLLIYIYVFIFCTLILIVFSVAFGIRTTDKIHNPYGIKIYSFHDHRI